MRRNLQGSNLVVEESPHSEPVQRLVTSAAYAAVVHVRRNSHAQSFLASPEDSRAMSFRLSQESHPSSYDRLTWREEPPRDSVHRSTRSPAPCTGRTISPNWAPNLAASLPPGCSVPPADPVTKDWISENRVVRFSSMKNREKNH